MALLPKRVLFVIGYGGFGGIERHVQCLIKNIDRSQVEPYLCVVSSSGAVSDAIAATGVPVYVINAPHGHAFKIIPKFWRIIRENKIELVHAHVLSFLVGVVMVLHPYLPLLVSIHCRENKGKQKPWPVRIVERLWNRIVEYRVDLWLPVSGATQAQALRSAALKTKSEVFFNPIQLPAETQKDKTWLTAEIHAPPDVLLVGMVGRMALGDAKDWPLFLTVCMKIAEIREDVWFIAVGDGGLKPTLMSSPAAIRLGERLCWMGFRDDARRIIAAIDVFLLTSKNEELPTTLLEAMSARTPVAGFLPLGGTAEVLDRAEGNGAIALLHGKRDPMLVVSDVMSLLDNSKKGNAMAERAFQTVQRHFEAQAACRRLVELYYRVLKDKAY